MFLNIIVEPRVRGESLEKALVLGFLYNIIEQLRRLKLTSSDVIPGQYENKTNQTEQTYPE